MLRYGRERRCRTPLAGLAAAAALALAIPVTPAAAESLVELMVSGFRVPPPPPPGPPTDLLRSMFEGNARRPTLRGSGTGGPHAAFCVRLCDGRYFPIQAHRNMSAATQCKTFCPASATRIFSGSQIDYAVASNGRRYADLPNAFVYRTRIVPGCTCNGNGATGVARVTVADDLTLRAGDIVATNSGLTVYNGRNPQQQTAFTPIENAKVSQSLRNRLADVRVAPQLPAADEAEPPPAVPDEVSSIAGVRPRFIARAQ